MEQVIGVNDVPGLGTGSGAEGRPPAGASKRGAAADLKAVAQRLLERGQHKHALEACYAGMRCIANPHKR